ncbi:MAG: diaminopimelate epimerase [Kofleriaceae bacterium]
MRFSKYHGLGNDFVVVDLRATDAATTAAIQEPAVVQAVCDRQFGVGGDGVLAILPGGTDSVARMRVLNADGSEAEMCGNGIRCVVEELARAGIVQATMAIATGAGRLSCERIAGGVTVEMGAPRLTRGEIPMAGPASERCIAQPIEAQGTTFAVTGVSMGNPHAVIFIDDPSANLRALAETYGPTLEHHASFPARTNVEFVRARGRDELEVVVWERGVGITLACGTGACATVVAAILNDRAAPETDVHVHLLGGTLTIRVLASLANVRMTGPATHVFDGELDPRSVRSRPS